MSIFNELLPKLSEISNTITKNFNDDLKAAFECFDKLEEEYQNGRARAREKAPKDKNPMTTLQSINEDDDEPNKLSDAEPKRKSSKSTNNTDNRSSVESNSEKPRRGSKKRSKNEVDGLSSPEQDKRLKRNASIKAQSIISKQVNVNLTQKMRREESSEKIKRNNKKKDDDKENTEPAQIIQIKQEKISLPPEPMDMESLPLNIEVKQEPNKDDIAMPPPAAPVPRPRKAAAKDKAESSEESSGRRTTRTRKQTDTAPVAAPRATRGSSRVTRDLDAEQPPPEPRPKRTRGRKKVSEVANTDSEKESAQASQESAPASPAEKPRPKRTRRGQKAAEKETAKPEETPKPEETQPEPVISPKEERISQPESNSPILQPIKSKIPTKETKSRKKNKEDVKKNTEIEDTVQTIDETDTQSVLEQTRIITMNSTVTIMDKTVDLPNGVYNHDPGTPNNVRHMNETVVLETCSRETIVLEKPHAIMDATVVIDKDPKHAMMAEHNSLLTDDEDAPSPRTPPKQQPPKPQPTSAVKEKVQQFEELASRVTRTKTRAMAKKEEDKPEDSHTPPDKIMKAVLSADTLNKMNSMIFNGKPAQQISSSASKPRANVVSSVKSFIPASTSKLSSVSKHKEAAEESLKREKEDARKKKEAMLEAKREQQKKKREEKMAAAAAVREAAERERRAAMEAAARERMEKQAHVDQGKLERLKETERSRRQWKERRAAMEAAARERMEKQAHVDQGKLERLKETERKKQELARKVAETEERRRAEEQARQQRLADEQKRADALRRKQIEEAEAMKKEAAIMAKEIEKRQKEYIEKQKLKHRLEDKQNTPLKVGTPGHSTHTEPVYMADGFQYLNSDSDSEPPERPVPAWSTSKARKQALMIQCQVSQAHVDRLFSVRVHSPDLRHIFPDIERARLKRTSSAVWRTPPGERLPALHE